MREYQNGIRFRSICADCNNRLLGQYDVAYLDMVNKIEQLINRAASGRNHIILTDADTINVQINRLCKAICGHLLSAKDEYDNETSIDKRLRKYVLDPEAIPDEKYHLFCWFYPYNTKIVLRDVVVIENHCNMTAPEGTISIMQSYPVAFLLTSQNEKDLGMIDLFKYATTDIDERVDLPFKWSSCFYPNTSLIRHYVWPCNIGNDSYSAAGVFGGKSIDSSRIGVAKRKVK